jgi:tetratricopeptide (TPR) repeat protein
MTTVSLLLPLALVLAAPGGPSDAQKRDEARRHFEQGEKNMQEEAFERAVREFQAAIELDPLMVLAHYNLGQAHMALKQYPQAVQAYQGCRAALKEINSLEQEQVVAREQQTDDEIRELQEVARRLRAAREADTGNRVMMVEERIRVLESTRRKGGQVAPEPAELPLALGSAYFRQGALEDAEREYKQAVALDAKLGAAYNNLAVIHMLGGRFAQAREAVKKAEKAGFPVHPNLKRDLEAREKAAAAKP